jgi:anti-sigma B factor antagonist
MRHAAGATVVAVTGELDVLTAPRLTTSLDDLIRRGQGNIVIDLSGAGFIDSLGLHTLLNLQRRLAHRSRSLAVVCGDGPIRRAIELARLEDALGVVSSLAEYELGRAARSA